MILKYYWLLNALPHFSQESIFADILWLFLLLTIAIKSLAVVSSAELK